MRQNIFVINNFWLNGLKLKISKNNKISLVAIMVCATQWKSSTQLSDVFLTKFKRIDSLSQQYN